MRGQPALGIERRFAAHSRGGDRLLINRIGHVAGGEDALDARGCAEGFGQLRQLKPLSSQFELTFEKLRVGRVADRHEHPRCGEGCCLAGLQVLQSHGCHAEAPRRARVSGGFPQDLFHHRIPVRRHLWIGKHALGHDRAGAIQRIAAMNQMHGTGEFREIIAFFAG